jgi:hypothetical protein
MNTLSELVQNGYTVSTTRAAFGRIGTLYVMRDQGGHQIALPINTTTDHLREVWEAFDRAATGNEPMPDAISGEIVASKN